MCSDEVAQKVQNWNKPFNHASHIVNNATICGQCKYYNMDSEWIKIDDDDDDDDGNDDGEMMQYANEGRKKWKKIEKKKINLNCNK